MISEQEAREAKARLDDFYNGIARDILARYALQELARRDWQDEPDGEGRYWLECLPQDRAPVMVLHFDKPAREGNPPEWYWRDHDAGQWTKLIGRVCKITERPA